MVVPVLDDLGKGRAHDVGQRHEVDRRVGAMCDKHAVHEGEIDLGQQIGQARMCLGLLRYDASPPLLDDAAGLTAHLDEPVPRRNRGGRAEQGDHQSEPPVFGLLLHPLARQRESRADALSGRSRVVRRLPGRAGEPPRTVGVIERLGEQLVLVAELPVDRRGGQACAFADQRHGGAVVPALGGDGEGGVEDALPRFLALAMPTIGLGGHRGRHTSHVTLRHGRVTAMSSSWAGSRSSQRGVPILGTPYPAASPS